MLNDRTDEGGPAALKVQARIVEGTAMAFEVRDETDRGVLKFRCRLGLLGVLLTSRPSRRQMLDRGRRFALYGYRQEWLSTVPVPWDVVRCNQVVRCELVSLRRLLRHGVQGLSRVFHDVSVWLGPSAEFA